MPCGSLFGFPLRIPPDYTLPLGSLPRFLTSNAFDREDVGYIRRGYFHLLFHTGCSSGTAQVGIDVPRTFRQSDVGPILRT